MHENVLTDASFNDTLIDAALETNPISESEDASDETETDSEGLPHIRPSWRCATYGQGTSWKHRKPPTEIQAIDALNEIQNLLRPRRSGRQKQYKESKVQKWGQKILGQLEIFLNLFTGANSNVKGKWMEASKEAAIATGRPTDHQERRLREEAKKFIFTHKVPKSPFGASNISIIDADEELAQEINLYLQEKGKYVKANDIAEYLKKPEVQSRWNLKKTISKATCERWMKKLGYRWVKKHRGQYVDGHEREDVVKYRQDVFLPAWYDHESRMRSWDNDGNEIPPKLPPATRVIIPWFHDESIFYAHDRREPQWVRNDASPVPYAKGERPSMLDAEFFSPDYGYCRSHDGKKSARVIFKPGKNRDGYFDSEDFIKQVNTCMDILEADYPDEEHLLIFDNATIHTKRQDDALSARKMPKFPPKEGNNWGIEVTQRGPDGKVIYGPNGKPAKIKIRMEDAHFRDGTPQRLYFEAPHPLAGTFKGMAIILEERGYVNTHKLRAECKNFKCAAPELGTSSQACCCRRLLFNEPDFVNVKSILELHCEKRGFKVLFLPKFHCELNPLEMVWGRAKYHYRLNPPSSKEEDLQHNMLKALDDVTLEEMRR